MTDNAWARLLLDIAEQLDAGVRPQVTALSGGYVYLSFGERDGLLVECKVPEGRIEFAGLGMQVTKLPEARHIFPTDAPVRVKLRAPGRVH